ncbi:MAG: RluA family pseudouridine synthase [Oscillospiraceae bacterium]|nr:RluA family pseudouridine synthase [Oscillospiraceae bacterium]
MKELIIGTNDAGQRLDRFVSKAVPSLPSSLLQKYIRLKRIKLNGKGAARETRLKAGDILQLYLNDEFFSQPDPDSAYRRIAEPRLHVVYEDQNILLADKAPGMPVHPDAQEATNTLIAHIQSYLFQKGDWNPERENAFTPALCNRIDRNTGGLVIAAKNAEALRIVNRKIKDREMKKFYLCVVYGTPRPASGCLEGYIRKDAAKNRVTVMTRPAPGARKAITIYRTLSSKDGLSLLECQLITGRTHQIRAQLSAAGHPLLGDGKYGSGVQNRARKQNRQALLAWKLEFVFRTPAGSLEYLNGASFQTDDTKFRREYFPV